MFAVDFKLEIDSSVFLNEMPHIILTQVHYDEKTILRLPYFWSDDGEMSIKRRPLFSLRDKNFSVPGLKILCFHPIHIFINSKDMSNYDNLKSKCDIKHCTEEVAEPLINKGAGAGSLLREIIKSNPNPGGFKTLSEIAAMWRTQSRGE
jgi:hypothetical protein